MDMCELNHTALYSDGLLIAMFYIRQFYQTILHYKLHCNCCYWAGE